MAIVQCFWCQERFKSKTIERLMSCGLKTKVFIQGIVNTFCRVVTQITTHTHTYTNKNHWSPHLHCKQFRTSTWSLLYGRKSFVCPRICHVHSLYSYISSLNRFDNFRKKFSITMSLKECLKECQVNWKNKNFFKLKNIVNCKNVNIKKLCSWHKN